MWEIKLLKDRGIVNIIQSDIMNKNNVIQITEEAIRYGKENGINKYLVDHRNMMFESFLSVLDIYHLPKDIEKIGGKPSNKVAVIISSENERKNDFAFLETVFHNNGSRVSIFTQEDEALEWLSEN